MCIIHVCQVQHKKISLSSPSSHLSDSLLQTESCPHSFISPRLFVWKTPSSGPQSKCFRSPALRYIKRQISFAPLHQSLDPSCGDRSSVVFISCRRRREIREGDPTDWETDYFVLLTCGASRARATGDGKERGERGWQPMRVTASVAV